MYRDRFGAGAGGGISRGWGSPAFRALLSAGAPDVKKPPPVATPARRHLRRAAPTLPELPPPPPDRGNDSIPDAFRRVSRSARRAEPDKLRQRLPADRDRRRHRRSAKTPPDAAGMADPQRAKERLSARAHRGRWIKITEQFRFKTSKAAELFRDSDVLILAIASTMKKHPGDHEGPGRRSHRQHGYAAGQSEAERAARRGGREGAHQGRRRQEAPRSQGRRPAEPHRHEHHRGRPRAESPSSSTSSKKTLRRPAERPE